MHSHGKDVLVTKQMEVFDNAHNIVVYKREVGMEMHLSIQCASDCMNEEW
jgi:hypothetical protein